MLELIKTMTPASACREIGRPIHMHSYFLYSDPGYKKAVLESGKLRIRRSKKPTKMLTFRVSENEHEIILDAVKTSGLSLSDFIRKSIFNNLPDSQ